jgi:hypothetical protein
MFREHHLLRTPPDDTILWRYLDLSHFINLLDRRSLYFANLREFTDEWEGVVPATSIEAKRRYLENFLLARPGSMESKMVRDMERSFRPFQGGYGVNCWHKNKVESVAMWKLYTHGKDGVAVQTTVGRLKKCLSEERREILIVEVQYDDHEIIYELESDLIFYKDPIIPVITKRRSFAHESEVRVLLVRQNRKDVSGATLSELSTGEAVTVDLAKLIERIFASPDYPAWAISSLQDRVTAAGLQVQVETSDLLRQPRI